MLWKYINDGNLSYFILLLSDNSSTTLHVAYKLEQQNLAHTWIMVLTRPKIKTLSLLAGESNRFYMQTCLFRFLTRNQAVLSLPYNGKKLNY